jgi:uncharacterized protein YcbK (DUF882 family)
MRLRLPRSLGSILAVAAPFVLAAVAFVVPASVSAAPNGKDKKESAKPSKKKSSKVAPTAKKLPPLPAKTDEKEPEQKPVEPTTATAKKSDDIEEPPVELTGALPEAKLANKKPKKPKVEADKVADKSDKKDAKKVVASKTKTKSDDDKDAKKKGDKGKDVAKDKKDPKGPKAVVDDKIEKKAKDKDVTPEFGGIEKDPDKKPKVKTCLNPAVTFARLGQPTDVAFALTTCKGKVAPLAIEYLSILGRPYDLPQPTWMKPAQVLNLPAQQIASEVQKTFDAKSKSKDKNAKLGTKLDPKDKEVAPGIKRLDAGLVVRLQAIADKFPGKTITLVSGYRPKSAGSPHKAGHAFDIRLDGVTNETLVAFCKTLKDTGCGYYPNSYFVHVDVREPGTGHVFWIDVSGPGEKPQYVKSWPPPALPQLPKSNKVVANEATAPQLDESSGKPIDATTDTTTIGPIDEVTEEPEKTQ